MVTYTLKVRWGRRNESEMGLKQSPLMATHPLMARGEKGNVSKVGLEKWSIDSNSPTECDTGKNKMCVRLESNQHIWPLTL